MKKYILLLIIFLITIAIQSCDNIEQPTREQSSQDRKFEVVYIENLSSASTRAYSDSLQSSGPILKFRDQRAYEQTLDSVRALSEDEKISFFQQIGFEGAYMILNNANEELDIAFDRAETLDSIAGVNLILNCMAKYDGVLLFNEKDSNDVTPSLPFYDEKAELLGNKDGYVMIGQEIVAPQYAAPGPPYNGSFIKYKAEVKVKNGKYTSYFRLGRIGSNMGFQLETYRRILCFKKSDNNCCYDGELEIYSNGKSEKIVIHNSKGNWKMYSHARNYSPRINMKMKNFSSTRNSNNKVSKTILNILVQ